MTSITMFYQLMNINRCNFLWPIYFHAFCITSHQLFVPWIFFTPIFFTRYTVSTIHLTRLLFPQLVQVVTVLKTTAWVLSHHPIGSVTALKGRRRWLWLDWASFNVPPNNTL